MDKRTDIITGAETVFEEQGFRGIGVDGILAPSGASTRTLYKHFGSRDGLVLAVLDRRHYAFMSELRARVDDSDPIGGLFEVLERWMVMRGASGCMLLRAFNEYAGSNKEIVNLVEGQKKEFQVEVAKRIEDALGSANEELATQVWLLFEGATALAAISGPSVVKPARLAAEKLLQLERGRAQ